MIDRQTLTGALAAIAIIALSLVAGYYSSWLLEYSPVIYGIVLFSLVSSVVYGSEILDFLRDRWR